MIKVTSQEITDAIDYMAKTGIEALVERLKKGGDQDPVKIMEETFSYSRDLFAACIKSEGFNSLVRSHIKLIGNSRTIELKSLFCQSISTGIEIGLKIAENKKQTDFLEELMNK